MVKSQVKKTTKPPPPPKPKKKQSQARSKKKKCCSCCKCCCCCCNCNKCRKKWCTLVLLLCWLVLFLTLGFGLFTLFHPNCKRFPNFTPYPKDRTVFYATVTFMFWTTLFNFLFILCTVKCNCAGGGAKCLKNLWAFIHIMLGISLIYFLCDVGRDKQLKVDALQAVVGKTPQNQRWLLYAQKTEICCGIGNSMDVPDDFVKSYCDKVFHSKRLAIGCGSVVRAYVKHCQSLLLLFAIVATSAGLLPFAICSRRFKKKPNAVGPSATKDREGQADSDSDKESKIKGKAGPDPLIPASSSPPPPPPPPQPSSPPLPPSWPPAAPSWPPPPPPPQPSWTPPPSSPPLPPFWAPAAPSWPPPPSSPPPQPSSPPLPPFWAPAAPSWPPPPPPPQPSWTPPPSSPPLPPFWAPAASSWPPPPSSPPPQPSWPSPPPTASSPTASSPPLQSPPPLPSSSPPLPSPPPLPSSSPPLPSPPPLPSSSPPLPSSSPPLPSPPPPLPSWSSPPSSLPPLPPFSPPLPPSSLSPPPSSLPPPPSPENFQVATGPRYNNVEQHPGHYPISTNSGHIDSYSPLQTASPADGYYSTYKSYRWFTLSKPRSRSLGGSPLARPKEENKYDSV